MAKNTVYVLTVMTATNEGDDVNEKLSGSILSWVIHKDAYQKIIDELGPPDHERMYQPEHVEMAKQISDDMIHFDVS